MTFILINYESLIVQFLFCILIFQKFRHKRNLNTLK